MLASISYDIVCSISLGFCNTIVIEQDTHDVQERNENNPACKLV